MTPNKTTNEMTYEIGFPPKAVYNQFTVLFVCLFICKFFIIKIYIYLF